MGVDIDNGNFREILGCSLWTRFRYLSSKSEDSKLHVIIYAIFFEVTPLVWPQYLSVTDGRTDWQTDRQH